MAMIKETDPRFAGIEKKIGIFVITAIAGIVLVAVFLGIQQDIFIPKTTIFFVTESGQDLNEGMAVKLRGFKIGKVRKVLLDDSARVTVELSINKKYMKWVRTDSRAKLAKEGLIGESIIEITRGAPEAKEIETTGVIPFEREKGISEMAEELKTEIKPLFSDIRQIFQYVNDPNGDIKQALKNVKKVTADIDATRQHLDTLLKDTNKNISSITAKIDPVISSAKQTLETAGAMIKKIDKDIPQIMERINNSLENVQKTTEELKNSASQIPPIIEKGNELTGSTKEVLDSVKQVWPISSYIEEPKEKTLKMDSYE